MTRYSKEIKEFSEVLRSDERPLSDVLKELESIRVSIEESREQKMYTLPYSSNPKPLGERWRTA